MTGPSPRRLEMTWSLLGQRDRRLAVLLLPMFALSALLQAAGVASVLPFLSLVSNPSQIHESGLLSRTYTLLGSPNPNAFLIIVGVASLVVLIVTNGIAAFSDWVLLRFVWRLNHVLSERMLERYLARPFSFFLNHNSAQLLNSLLVEVRQAVNGFVLPLLQLTVRGVVALFILGLLILANPLLAVAAASLVGGAYTAIFATIRVRLKRGGELRQQAAEDRFKAASEALGGATEIKLLGREGVFLARFRSGAQRFSRYNATQQVLSQLPRYGLETVAYGGLLFIVVFLLMGGADVSGLLPALGLYGLGMYRLLPATQVMFNSLSQIRFNAPALDILFENLQEEPTLTICAGRELEPLAFHETLVVRDICYRYPGTSTPVLRGLDMTVRANTRVGVVGATGSGKTTAIAVLMGMLAPEAGSVRVDDVELDEITASQWHRNIGYVPQHIFLTDDSVMRNIAFGVPDGQVDVDAVERAARLANIHDFIVDQLPRGYETEVGERGVRLSGGQRQRVGIARAMYHDPAVLILDEATSALDTVTEQSVLGAINQIGQSKTIVQIAHRLTTVRDADLIYLLEAGRVEASGTYEELMASSQRFRALAMESS